MSKPKAHFMFSASSLEQVTSTRIIRKIFLPEVAIVGRSNVGKSSLINHLTQISSLAKTSSHPGKTTLINFFSIDEKFALVDLPGYGFAARSKEMKVSWGETLQEYLDKSPELKLILLLCDIRHLPSKQDLALAKWALFAHKPFILIFTKTDTLNPSEVTKRAQAALASFAEHLSSFLSNSLEKEDNRHFSSQTQIPCVYYSVKQKEARVSLMKKVLHFL